MLAGVTVWAVLVPESLAYATIAGVPPVVGLYAAVPAMVLYSLLGTSRHLVVAPMSATAALSATVVAHQYARTGSDPVALTAALALLVGAVAVAAGLLRLGFIASFVSAPVMQGFVIGLALTIVVGQLPALLGVEATGGSAVSRVGQLVTSLGATHLPTTVLGLGALTVLLLLRRWAPLVPAALVVVALGALLAASLDLEQDGVEVVGEVPAGLPSLALPHVTGPDVAGMLLPALGVLLIAFVEGLSAASAYADRDSYRIDPDGELTAVGAANVGAGLLGGMVVNGSLSKTSVNAAAGARSQLSGVVAAGATALTLLFLTEAFSSLPDSVLAAVVIVAVIGLVDVGQLRELRAVWTPRLGRLYGRAARADFAAAVAALVGVLVVDVLAGLAVGVGVSMLLLVYRASRPHVTVLEPAQDGVVVVRIEGGLFFANATAVCERLRAVGAPGHTQALVVDAVSVPTIDVTAARTVTRLATDLDRLGVRLWVARATGQVRDVLHQTGTDAVLVTAESVEQAVRGARSSRPGTGPAPADEAAGEAGPG